MWASISSNRIYRFDKFEADLRSGQLRKRGMKVALRGQSFVVLTALLEDPGEVVTRQELRRRLWSEGVFVEYDNLLNAAVARLRAVLGDSAANPRFIETLPRRGYRFIASISESEQKPGRIPRRRFKMAVLPFVNLSNDSSKEYLAEGMTEEVITDLAILSPERLAVIARTTAMQYRKCNKDIACIGRELGVDYVVEGSIYPAKSRLDTNVQLIQVSDQMHLFARKYEAKPHDLFRVAKSAAFDIASGIGISPEPDAHSRDLDRKRPTRDLVAYKEYIQARNLMAHVTTASFAEARRLLESAIARDSEFALAYDALSETYWYMGYMGFVPPREAFSAGIIHALRALEIDNASAETHALLGQFHKTVEYNWPEVYREMKLARQLAPDSPLVKLRYAVSWLMPQGYLKEAVAEVESALQTDPLSVYGRNWLAILLVLSHQPDRTLDAARRLLEIDPDSYIAYLSMGSAYRERGDFEKSIAAYRTGMEASAGSPAMIGWLGLALGVSGNQAEARSLLERLHNRAAQGYVPPTSFAWIHLGLGEIDTGFEWLDRAVSLCDQYMMPIKSYSFFDPIRNDPRFLALLRKMNLAPSH